MTGPVASLNTAWFALIGLLWTGYFVLEGFDFGVGHAEPGDRAGRHGPAAVPATRSARSGTATRCG